MNEYMNLVEVAERLVKTFVELDREMVVKLAKQILDEANHYNMVAEIVERLTGRPLDVQLMIEKERSGGSAKGARCLQGIPQDDLLGLHTYQFIAEGRAVRVWQRMSEVITDELISNCYSRIAKDEKFHAAIGRQGLEALARTEKDQARVQSLVNDMRRELYIISAENCLEVPEARRLVEDAYGPLGESAA